MLSRSRNENSLRLRIACVLYVVFLTKYIYFPENDPSSQVFYSHFLLSTILLTFYFMWARKCLDFGKIFLKIFCASFVIVLLSLVLPISHLLLEADSTLKSFFLTILFSGLVSAVFLIIIAISVSVLMKKPIAQ